MSRIISPGKKYEQLPMVLEAAINIALDKTAESISEQLIAPTKTWKHRVVFRIYRQLGTRIIATDDAPYKFVSRGTRWRYAVMTPDFVAKTSPRRMISTPGAGGVAFIGKKKMPGITAREFEEEARDIEQRTIAKTFNTEIQNALNKFYKGFTP